MGTLFVKQISIEQPLDNALYYAALPAVRALCEAPLTLRQPVTFLVGENGVGKSTLLEAIAIALGFNPEGGSKNFNFSTADSHADLYHFLRIAKGTAAPRDGYFLRAESFYNVASHIDELDRSTMMGPPIIQSYGGVSLHEQSHGESFLALAEERFGGHGLYLLDEPEAALSPMRQMRLLCRIDQLVKQDSQFIISTHSPILMTFPGAQVLQIDQSGIREVPYWETEAFQLTRRFLNDPAHMLELLLQDEK